MDCDTASLHTSSSLTVIHEVSHSDARAVRPQQTVRHASCRHNIRGDVTISCSTTRVKLYSCFFVQYMSVLYVQLCVSLG